MCLKSLCYIVLGKLSSSKPVLVTIVVSLSLAACGGLSDFSGLPNTDESQLNVDPDPVPDPGQNPTMVQISWDPIEINGGDAVAYRVLYSSPGERPKEVVTESTQAELETTSLNNYTVYIEGFDVNGNSEFESYETN